VEVTVISANCNVDSSTAFWRQVRAKHSKPLIVIWDNRPADRGPQIREYLTTPNLRLRLTALPPYTPDLNPDEAIGD
jgi:transposase